MQVQLRKLSSIKPHKRNPRLNEKAVEAVARSEASKSRCIAIWSLTAHRRGQGRQGAAAETAGGRAALSRRQIMLTMPLTR